MSSLVERFIDGAGAGRGVRGRWRVRNGGLALWVCLWLVAPLVCAGGAFGAVSHTLVWSAGEAPFGSRLGGPSSVAVDSGSGRVFVGDPLAGWMDVFGGSGQFVARFGGGMIRPVGVGVDEGSEDVFVADGFTEGVDVYGPDGSGGYVLLGRWWGSEVPGGEFGVVAGVAVDNSSGPSSGDVYVLEEAVAGGGGAAIDVFKPGLGGGEGTFVGRLSASKLVRPNGIAVDQSSGRVFVADSVAGAVFVYGSEGAYEEKLNGKGSPFGSFKSNEELGNVAGVGVDPVSSDVSVAEAQRGVVSQYGFEGGEWRWQGWVVSMPSGDLGEPRGVAVGGSDEVVVADTGLGRVDMFGPGVVAPGVETGKAAKSSVQSTSAVLPGQVNGEGTATSYFFQYGETKALGSKTSSEPLSVSTGWQAVSASVKGLLPDRVYYYRVVGLNGDGANYGLTRRFETRAAVEGLETGPVTGVVSGGGTLTGVLERDGLVTHYYFQYGTSTVYGSWAPVPAGEVPASATEKEEKQPKTVATVLSGLNTSATYHYRLVAENENGATYGQDQTFGAPVIMSEPVGGLTQTGVTLNARVDPEQSGTVYQFQYGETIGYGQETSPASLAAGSAVEAVSGTVSALRVGVTYHYRVIAENAFGSSTGPDQTFSTMVAAPVEATFSTNVESTAAVLHGLVDPLGNDTHAYFQYGTSPCQANPGGCASIPLPPGQDVGSGSTDAPVQASVNGLTPHTTYHYRVIATNTRGTTEGPERTFTTKAQAASPFVLPDGRAWEMVTPPEKGSAPVEALTREGGVILASDDGGAITYVADGALGQEVEGNRSPEMQQILATRTPSGWTNEDIATPNDIAKGMAPGNAPEYQYFTPGLALGLVEPLGAGTEPPLAGGVSQNTAYLRDNATKTYLPLVTEANTAPGTVFDGHIHFVAGTPNLDHVLLESEVTLTESGAPGLYEWSGGRLRFVSRLPGGKPAKEPQAGYYGVVLPHAVASDGSRIFWTNKEDLGTRGGHLYLRDMSRGETTKLDAAQGVAEPEKGSAEFQGASSNGSRVFFIDRQRLTAASTAEPGQGAGEPDLYECQIVEVAGRLACELHDLTVDYQGGHADVQGLVLGISEDGGSVFLIAQGVLATNTNGNGEQAVAGRDNLYELRYDGKDWARTFIATLAEADSTEWEGDQIGNLAYVTARVSPNGRYFAFMSQAPVTRYDNVDANPTAKGARDEEVFLYDSVTGSLRCVSCNPSGARPNGVLDAENTGEGLGLVVDRRLIWGREGHEHWLAGSVPGWTAQSLVSALYQSRYLANDGRLFFNSPDDLVPAAENHKEDVYEYEPAGVGGCQSPSGGCIALISGGSSDRESAFLEATPDGSSVFFLTEARLLGQDTDTAFDIYDARECTEASPCLTPPPEKGAPCIETDTCRPAEPAEPIPGGPAGTAAFAGPGNTITPPSSETPTPSGEVEARKISKRLTRPQKRKRAFKVCRKRYAHSRHKRKACEHRARKRYAKKHKAKKKHKPTKGGRKAARVGAFDGSPKRSAQ